MHPEPPGQKVLRDLYRQQREAADAKAESERRRRVGELRDRLAGGDSDPGTWIKLADQLEALREHDAALEVLREARERSSCLDIHIKYIYALRERNRTEEAILAATEALRIFPDSLLSRLSEGLTLPIIYDTPEQLEYYRRRFSMRLRELSAGLTLDTAERRADACEAIHHHDNFYLGYQMRDDRELQVTYANLVIRILSARYPELVSYSAPPPDSPDRRIRVGYISSHFERLHSVSKLFQLWIANHNREDFEIFVYQVGELIDGIDNTVREGSDHFRHLTGDLPSVCSAIRADKLHAVVFPDLGMDSRLMPLSMLRLAPVACVTWGHPITSGSPAIDFFLSSELMEPPGGEEHYSERLVRLPGIGVCYPKPAIPRALLDRGRSRFGLRDDSTVYLCCQSIFKYLPHHDEVFVEIAKRVHASQFVFLISKPDLVRDFRKRLERVFNSAGLSVDDHCVMLPQTGMWEYWALNLASDIYLDSLDWSGFNTTMEAIACGLPVVTLPGDFMRGRHSYAILTQLGPAETIAKSKEDYVDIAVRLGLDSHWRKQVVEKMSERYGGICSDMRSVVALERFLRDAVTGATGS